MMHGREKSDSAIVAVKPTNKAVPTAAEPERLDDPGADQAVGRRLAPETANPSSMARESPLDIQGGSRMPELGPYGSVRGARGNSRPYRESDRLTAKPSLLARLRI